MKRNIVHYVTRQYMKQNKKRTLTAYIGIVFMVMLMTCVFIGKNTGLSFIGQVAQQKYGKWHVCMYGIKADAVSALKDIDYVKETAASADYGDTEFLKSGNKEKPYLTVKAYSKNCFDWMNITLKEGRLPKNGNELVISESALEDGAKIKTGDTVSAEFFKRSITGIDKETEKTVFPFYNIKVSYKETVEVPQGFPYFGENDSFRENKTFTGKKKTTR